MEIYKDKYNKFIKSRELRTIPKDTYTENHHILPRSLGGNDLKENIIILTAREHFIAHMILWKVYGGKMAQAFYMMQGFNRYNYRLTSRQYSKLREESIKYLSFLKKSKTYEEIYGVELGKEMKTRKKKWASINSPFKEKDVQQKAQRNRKNLPRTEEQKNRMSIAQLNKVVNPIVEKIRRNKISKAAKLQWINTSKQERDRLSKLRSKGMKGKQNAKGVVRSKQNRLNISNGSQKIWNNRTEKEKQEIGNKISLGKLGKPSKNKGKKGITNGVVNKRIDAQELPLDGWWFGTTRK